MICLHVSRYIEDILFVYKTGYMSNPYQSSFFLQELLNITQKHSTQVPT